jgi:Holliday junction DNA helicase RuvB
MIEKFDGGPVGVDSLAAAIGEERGTIEDVLEPYLIQQGYHAAHAARAHGDAQQAYLHFGLQPRGALRDTGHAADAGQSA